MNKKNFIYALLIIGFIVMMVPFVLLFSYTIQGSTFGNCSGYAAQWATTFILPVLGIIIGGAAPTVIENIRGEEEQSRPEPLPTVVIVFSLLLIYVILLIVTLLIAAGQGGVKTTGESECLAIDGSPLAVLERSGFGLAAWCLFLTTGLGWFFAKSSTPDKRRR